MNKTKTYCFQLPAIVILLIIFSSCNNSENIPFPESELGYSQPVTVPLLFSAAKPLKWDTAKKGGITPVVQKLDIDALPSQPYDTTGFITYNQPPEVVNFDFNSLPDADFSLDKLPSKPLRIKTSVLGPPATVKAGKPVPQKGRPLSIFDLGQAQGFQSKLITSLFIDRGGLLWIGSSEGLFRYDGEHIQTFVRGSSTGRPMIGIAEDFFGNIWFIEAGTVGVIDIHNGTIGYTNKVGFFQKNLDKMTLDDKGNIWIYNMADKAVSVIDPITRTYKNIGREEGLSDSLAFQVLQDDSKRIWITTYGGGADIIDLSAGKIKYLKKSGGLSSDSLTAMSQDSNGQVWVAGSNGLDAVDIKKGTIKHYNQLQGLKKNYTLGLCFDNKGYLWRNTLADLEVSDLQNGRIRYISETDGLTGNVVTAVTPDRYNRMWVATTNGLNIIDQNAETVHPLGTTQIISLMEDAVNNLWVATQKGIYIVNPQRNAMRLLDKSNGLSDNFVQSYWKKNGNMVVATDGGFNIIDPVRKTILKAGKKEGLVSDTIYVAFSDNSGNIWLTGPSNGIDMVDSAKNITLHTDVAGGLNDDNIQDVKQDRDGLIWLATNTDGIDIIDPVAGTIKYLNNQPGLKDTCNRMMLEDKYGRMWIGTDKGIYVADTKAGTLTSINTDQGLSNNTVLSLLEYNGSVVAGTNNKITIITAPALGDTAKEWKISLLDKSVGLIKETNSWSTDCITKKGEYLWGDVGITIINNMKPAADSVGTYITGMNVMTEPQNFINKGGYNANDTLWSADTFYVGSERPLNMGYSDEHKFRLDSVSGPYDMPVNLAVPYNSNYWQFQFTQANLSRQDNTSYTYILDGIDKKWSPPATSTTTENYLNLPSGKYTFKVASKGIDGKWGTPAVFRFTIAPPWYKTWWAYTLFTLLGIVILRAYIVYRSRRLKKENRILEEKVALRTSQLQKSLEDLKATQTQLIQSEKMASLGELTAGIAHEIQNPLNFVNNFSEINTELADEIKEELDKTNLSPSEKLPIEKLADDIKSNQEKINFHGKRADAIVKGMLQHSRSSNGQKELTDINALADEYLRLAYHGLRAKDKTFNATMKTEFDEAVGKMEIVPQDIGRVILNLITNGFYAVTEKRKQIGEGLPTGQAGYEPTVTVSTKKGGGKVIISVKDNGNGIPKKVLDKIFQPFFTTKPSGVGTGLGLSLSYDIIKAHGGELKVDTKEGEGAEFTVLLPG